MFPLLVLLLVGTFSRGKLFRLEVISYYHREAKVVFYRKFFFKKIGEKESSRRLKGPAISAGAASRNKRSDAGDQL